MQCTVCFRIVLFAWDMKLPQSGEGLCYYLSAGECLCFLDVALRDGHLWIASSSAAGQHVWSLRVFSRVVSHGDSCGIHNAPFGRCEYGTLCGTRKKTFRMFARVVSHVAGCGLHNTCNIAIYIRYKGPRLYTYVILHTT